LRGHWLDRLPAIDEDIVFMTNMLTQTQNSGDPQQENVRLAIQEAIGRPNRISAICKHNQPQQFKARKPLNIELSFEKVPNSVRLFYRHVNHAERFESVEMQVVGKSCKAIIPETYTDSEYPLQYYFILKDGPQSVWMYPGFNSDLTNQPYFVVRKA
jgi:hypothetical protein